MESSPLLENVEHEVEEIKKKSRKVKFTPRQDALIMHIMATNPTASWQDVSRWIGGKSAKQCRERFQHFLAPNVQRQPWTPDEDMRLCHMHHFIGNDWAGMVPYFPGRTNQDLKNRFNWHLKGREFDVFLNAMQNRNDVCELLALKPKL